LCRYSSEWKRQSAILKAARKEQDLPDALNPEATSMFKMTRGIVRLIMYYMKPTPPEVGLCTI
jgi:3'-phosphoadenosine 5'-phosphosulfate sulfotransferase